MTYRTDIDGLRAIAVLAVVFSHIGLSGFHGGYVGVDIFFVISGYLITAIIAQDIRESRFSIVRFYERRIRRIIPALVAVALPSALVGYLLMPPGDFKNFAQSLAATAGFISNVLFWMEAGYFESAAIYKPMLHTWSLAIEEQFYIILPLLLMLLARFGHHALIGLGAACALSFAVSLAVTERSPETAFFLMPFRFWELGLGSLLAIAGLSPPGRPLTREALGAVGLALIAFSITVYDESTLFPGAAALLPCLGAVLIIYTGGDRQTAVDKLLSLRPLTFIGLISYSLYLWHWPLISFYQFFRADSTALPRPLLDGTEMAIVVALSLIMATLSWRFVEQPFRRKYRVDQGFSPRFVFTATGSTLAMIIAFGAVVHVHQGWPWRFSHEAIALAQAAKSRPIFSCLDTGGDRADFQQLMTLNEEGPLATILWGDSHAAQWVPGIGAAAKRAGERIGYYGICGCPPIVGLERVDGKAFTCGANNNWMLNKIAESPAIDTVILASRLQYYMEGNTYGPLEARQSGPILTAIDGKHIAGSSQGDLVIAQLGHQVDKLQAMGKRVVLIYPVPEIGHHVPRTLFRLSVLGKDPNSFSVPKDMFTQRTSTAFAGLDALARQSNAMEIFPHEVLCDRTTCKTVIDRHVLYRDGDHLTAEGSVFLSPLFDPVFNRRRAVPTKDVPRGEGAGTNGDYRQHAGDMQEDRAPPSAR